MTLLTPTELFQYNNMPWTPRTRKLGDLLQSLLGYSPPARFFDESALQYIYVSSTGNDTTGDGLTPATAYATPNRAFRDLPMGWTADVWVQCAAGTYAGAQAWVLDVLPGARATVTASASTGRVSVVGDLTPIQSLTGGNVGAFVAGKLAQVTYNVGAYAATVTDGSHFLKEAAGVGTNGFQVSGNPVRASTTPNLVVVNSVTTAFIAPQLMTWTTIFSGAVTIIPPSWGANAGLVWFAVQGIRFNAACNAREASFRACKFDVGTTHVATTNISCTYASGTHTRTWITSTTGTSAISTCLFVAGTLAAMGPVNSISVSVFSGAPASAAHVMLGGASATITSSAAPGTMVQVFIQLDFEGTGDGIWVRGGAQLCASGGSACTFVMTNGRPILLYGDSHMDGVFNWTGTGALPAAIMNGSSMDAGNGYNVTNSVSAGQDVTVGELAPQARATRPTTSPVQLCRYN